MREAPEVRFYKSAPGVATMAAVGVAALVGAIAWVRRARGDERREREAMVAAATGASMLSVGFNALAMRQGWIKGGMIDMPFATQLLYSLPMSIGFYTAWLAGHRWLAEGARHPYALYGAVTAGFVPVALAAGAWETSRGYYQLGKGWKLGYNALVAQPLMWAPLAIYEGIYRWRPLPEDRPEAVAGRACGLPEMAAPL